MESTRRRAFTLIELLVVVAIIALLIAILVPALSAARTQAKNAKVSAQIHEISVALHAIANEIGDFPPSDPFPDEGVDPAFPTGAHLLAYYLVGDPLGEMPRGIKAAYMAYDKANAFPDDRPGRVGGRIPRVSVSGIDDLGGHGTYLIRDASYDTPILYYRANRRAKYPVNPPAGLTRVQGAPQAHRRASYFLADNAQITGVVYENGQPAMVPVTVAPGDVKFEKFPGWQLADTQHPDRELTHNGLRRVYQGYKPDQFASYIEIPGTRAPTSAFGVLLSGRAHNADSFLLIAAGKDRVYGPILKNKPNPGDESTWRYRRCDDIANFKVPQGSPFD